MPSAARNGALRITRNECRNAWLDWRNAETLASVRCCGVADSWGGPGWAADTEIALASCLRYTFQIPSTTRQSVEAMSTSEDNIDGNRGGICTIEHAVARLIGWKNPPLSSAQPSLMEQLRQRKDIAIVQYLKAEAVKKAAMDAAEGEAAAKDLAEMEAAVSECERQLDMAATCFRDIRADLAKGDDSVLRRDQKATDWTGEEFLTWASVEWWARKKYPGSFGKGGGLTPHTLMREMPPAKDEKPWLITDPDDPPAEQPWYTAARYFARELVKADTTLLTKRNHLAKRVAASLKAAGINKRGGKLGFAPGTVEKALVKVRFG